MTGPQSGFTLAEVLTGMAVLVIGLATVAAAFQYALSGIEAARGQTTAAFLAERKLEQLKAMGLTLVLSLVGTAVLGYALKFTIGLRPSAESEEAGLDVSDHGERGYHLTEV